MRDTARRVATGAHGAAIGIVNMHERVAIGRAGGGDDNDLIAANAKAAVGQMAQLRDGGRKWFLPGVDDNEIIAQPVHFGEGQHGVGIAQISV